MQAVRRRSPPLHALRHLYEAEKQREKSKKVVIKSGLLMVSLENYDGNGCDLELMMHF